MRASICYVLQLPLVSQTYAIECVALHMRVHPIVIIIAFCAGQRRGYGGWDWFESGAVFTCPMLTTTVEGAV